MENNNQILAGLGKLLHNKYLDLNLEDALEGIALLKDYFSSELNSEEDVEQEKILATAFIQTINSLDFIPENIKETSLYAGRGIIEVFRYIKLDYQLGDKPEEYRKELKENQVAQIAACFEVQIKKVSDIAIPKLIHVASVLFQHPIPQKDIYIYYNLIVNKLAPKSVKQKVNDVIKSTSKICASMVVAAIDGIKEVSQKTKSWVKEKLQPTIDKGAEKETERQKQIQ